MTTTVHGPGSEEADPWWRDAVIYQVYVRSFQDSDGDGEGDLPGLLARLDYLAHLGVDALWLSPVNPSPMADGGYDVTDYLGIDPRYGTLADFDALIAAGKRRGLRVMMDLVPSHTSIEHPWFRDDPKRYVWSQRDGPANNWVGVFGGSAWSRDPADRGWYLHTFFPEQPDLDWRQSRVRDYFRMATGFWVQRGIAGFRLDAINCLMKDALLRDDPPASARLPLPHRQEYALLEHRHSQNAADIGTGLRALREGAGDAALLIGEIYLPSTELAPYLKHLNAGFSFELLHAGWTSAALCGAIESGLSPEGGGGRVAWVLANHDCPRILDRVGQQNVRAAALMQLTLPGPVVIYQGDEIGMADGPGGKPPRDRVGRDRHRHPMRWDDEAPNGGFSRGDPWLPAIGVAEGGVVQQMSSPDSLLALYRDLISLRGSLRGALELLDADEGVLAYRRGVEHLVVLNLSADECAVPLTAEVLRATHAREIPAATKPTHLKPGTGFLGRVA